MPPVGGLAAATQPAAPNAAPMAAAPAAAGRGVDPYAQAANAAETPEFDISKELANRQKMGMELDEQIRKLQEAIARRKENLAVDPRWAAFTYAMSQPTKTGSAFEAIGSGLGAFSKAEQEGLTREEETAKLNAELATKRMELQKQLAGQAILGQLFGGQGQQVTPMGEQAAAMGQTMAAPQGGFNVMRPVSDRDLMASQVADPKTQEFLMKLRQSQIEAQKAAAGNWTKIRLPGTSEEVNVPLDVANKFFEVGRQAALTNNPQLLVKFMAENNIIQVRRGAEGELLPPPSEAEREADKASRVKLAEERARSSEALGNQLLTRGENAPRMQALAQDVISMTQSNQRAFELMQDATVRDSMLRAIEQGASAQAGPISVSINLPVRTALGYTLTRNDIQTLQLFQQRQSEITAEMRRAARVPGEGATDRAEGQLYAALGILPTDSAKVLAVKSEALVQRARYDARASQLWAEYQTKYPDRSFTRFKYEDQDFKKLQENYVAALDDMRKRNADLFRSNPAPERQQQAPSGSPQESRSQRRVINGQTFERDPANNEWKRVQ